jgi:hypothetical protein
VPDDPVTDTSKILDSKTFLDDAIAAAVKAASAPSPLPAKPRIGTLILFDAGDAHLKKAVGAVKSGYYPGGTLQGVQTWKELTAALATYSTIDTLVMFFHSAGGQLIFESENSTAEDVMHHLAASGTKVTGAIRFEGCNIMLEPVTTAYLVCGIAGPSATVTGYTNYSLFNDVTASAGFSTAQAQALLDSFADFWIPGTPSAEAIAATKTPLTMWLRWFRNEYNEDPLPKRPTGADPPKGFVPEGRLEQRTANSAEQALRLEKEFEAPVPPATLVIVRNIAAVAIKRRA